MAVVQRGLNTGKYPRGAEPARYSTEILRSPRQIRSLFADVCLLLDEPPATRDPHFFLASIDENAWDPMVVVVRRGDSTVGIVYAKERKFARLPTGLIYADATLDSMLISAPEDRETVLKAALEALLQDSGTYGLRVVVPETGFERDAIAQFLEDRVLDTHFARVENHNALTLPDQYEEFLERLGSRTRRNFRYYRRRFECQGHTYVEHLSLEEFSRVATELEKKCVPMAGRKGIERDLRVLSAAQQPILVGLRAKGGEWLSVLGGWQESGRAVVFLQLNNDREHPHSALCTVLRGYFIERLIARKVPNVLFWGGAVGTLRRYCQYLPAVCAHLNRRTLVWRTARMLIGRSVAFLPEHLRRAAIWVASVEDYEPGEQG